MKQLPSLCTLNARGAGDSSRMVGLSPGEVPQLAAPAKRRTGLGFRELRVDDLINGLLASDSPSLGTLL